MENVEKVFEKIGAIDYQHREGGRYAYVQLMAFLRDLKNELASSGICEQEQQRLEADGDLLNDMVHLRFEAAHRLVFEDKMKELQEMRRRIFTKTET
jgi:hypothetical protein